MADKEKEVKADKAEKADKVEMSEREARWQAFLARHKEQNPEKHAMRLAAGEFNKIPDSFR